MMTRKTFRKTHTFVAWLVLRVAVALALVGVMAGSCGGSANDTTRVSVSSSEAQADNWSDHPSISSDGRFVAFESEASNLVTNDTNGFIAAFVRVLQTGATERVSVNSSEAQADNWSDHPSISSDGRFVAFGSIATNLVANDTNGFRDAFVRDLWMGSTQRVSIDSSGKQGNLNSYRPSISSDGRFVAFESEASNLVANDTNNAPDIFVRDRQGGTTERVSVSSSEAQADGFNGRLSISSDGRFVPPDAGATNPLANDPNKTPDISVRDLRTDAT